MKALYALAFVLFSFAAPAQTPEASVAAYTLDDLECSGETTQQSAVSVETIATEPTIEKSGEATRDQADDVAITGPSDAAIPAASVQPKDESAIAANASRNDDRLAADTEQQTARPAQVVAIEPAIETSGVAKPTETDGVTTSESKDAVDVPAAAAQPNDESATPAQIIATGPAPENLDEAKPTEAEVATTEPNGAEEARSEAVQPTDESTSAKHAARIDETLTVDDTSEQGAMPAQLIATGPALEQAGDAKPTETDGAATSEPNTAKDTPVEAIEPTDESSTAKHATRSDETPAVDDTSGQNAMPPQVIATGPTLEQPGEAKPTETDGATTTEPNHAEDAPVEAIQPTDENASVKSEREARD